MSTSIKLVIRPISQDVARAFIATEHRHNKRGLPGWKFGSGLFHQGRLAAVGIAGRCSSRVLDSRGNLHFIEITRIASDGTDNACSQLYGSLTRAAKAIGYCRAYTYTLQSESGASLKASGWIVDEVLKPRTSGGWDCKSRPRDEADWPSEPKVRWVKYLSECDQHPVEKHHQEAA